jgi:hypothetical protein
MLRIRDHDVHRRPEGGSSMRNDCHEPPVTVLADDELPVLADPGDSEDELLEEELLDEEPLAVGEGVVVPVPMVVVVDAADPADDVPACVRAAAVARTATATAPATPAEAMSLVRRRNALSRSAGVMRRLGAAISAAPRDARRAFGAAPAHAAFRASCGTHRADR